MEPREVLILKNPFQLMQKIKYINNFSSFNVHTMFLNSKLTELQLFKSI